MCQSNQRHQRPGAPLAPGLARRKWVGQGRPGPLPLSSLSALCRVIAAVAGPSLRPRVHLIGCASHRTDRWSCPSRPRMFASAPPRRAAKAASLVPQSGLVPHPDSRCGDWSPANWRGRKRRSLRISRVLLEVCCCAALVRSAHVCISGSRAVGTRFHAARC